MKTLEQLRDELSSRTTPSRDWDANLHAHVMVKKYVPEEWTCTHIDMVPTVYGNEVGFNRKGALPKIGNAYHLETAPRYSQEFDHALRFGREMLPNARISLEYELSGEGSATVTLELPNEIDLYEEKVSVSAASPAIALMLAFVSAMLEEPSVMTEEDVVAEMAEFMRANKVTFGQLVERAGLQRRKPVEE